MKNITDQHSKYILEQIELGKSAYFISQQLGCQKCNILRFLSRGGVKSKHKCTVNYNNLLKDHQGEVLDLYKSGISGNQIAKKLGFSGSRITEFLNQIITIRPKNIYTLDESFFEKIDTEEKAYILGWWYSDGNVMKDGKIRISIQQDDEEIIHKIKSILQYNGPLYYKKSNNPKHKDLIEICINRQKVAQDLIKLGCIPNKSMTLLFPTLEQVPVQLIRHFVRGYFDGDGSINGTVMIVGTLSFCNTLKEILPCETTNIYQRYKDREPEKSSHQLFIGRRSEVEKFYHWIYDDATIWLSRKRDKFVYFEEEVYMI